jgi:hypothetical protein
MFSSIFQRGDGIFAHQQKGLIIKQALKGLRKPGFKTLPSSRCNFMSRLRLDRALHYFCIVPLAFLPSGLLVVG